ncbi:hypothetical protein THRCLA_00782 [Thraustotheca clavata]|uniref:Uncharacterized protein n=1 Tax=Thraustotheca clavata TaxID=74557 RepID=A0A1W0AAA6_9STRA|nr:hypothetical protein THRCLA_00782 [Thraustotheca clavata]
MMNTRARLAAAYSFPWTAYGLSWSNTESVLAVSSITEEYANHIDVLELSQVQDDVDMDVNKSPRYQLRVKATAEHPYPPTRVLWSPSSLGDTSRLASTADYLRIWTLQANSLSLQAVLSNARTGDSCAPLTSCDWSDADPHILGTSSIDTTCTIWDLNNSKQAKKQIIAHDGEVFDMAFSPLHGGSNIFGSVGADGSLRVFDIRCLESCTIAYETPDLSAILRLAWNKHDANYVAVMLVDSPTTLILDLRMSASPYAQLVNPKAQSSSVNSIAWSPTSSHHICTAGEDQEAILWNISSRSPELKYAGGSYINSLHWSSKEPDFIAMSIDKTVHVVTI